MIQPKQKEVSFTYKVKDGAVSGNIHFFLDNYYKNLYYIESDTLNFEVLDKDVTPPKIINIYLHNLQRTKAYFRISTDESVIIYSLIAEKGTKKPSQEDIRDKAHRLEFKRKTDTLEIHAKNETNQTSVTRTFIYHDTFFYFDNLEEETDYHFYYYL